MKRLISLSLAVLMLVSNVSASEISVRLNDEDIVFESQQPVIVEGRTLIPLRGVFEKLGYEIVWKGETKTAVFTKGENSVEAGVNKPYIVIDGDTAVSIDVAPQIINGSMMLPLRAIGEATGVNVSWDKDTKTVNIVSELSSITESELKTVQQNAKAVEECVSAYVLLDCYMKLDIMNIANLKTIIMMLGDKESIKHAVNINIENCNTLKEELEKIRKNYYNPMIIDKLMDIVDADIDYYKLAGDLYITKGYNITDEQFEFEIEQALTKVDNSINLFENYMKEEFSKSMEAVKSSKYNAGYEDKLTAEEKKARNTYYSEISEEVNESLSFLYGKASSATPEKFTEAANKLRHKLNSAYTPDICIFDREIMLIGCNMLENAGKSTSTLFGTDELLSSGYDKFRADYIRYNYCMSTFDYLFDMALDDYYETKYVGKNNENSDSEFEKKFEIRAV